MNWSQFMQMTRKKFATRGSAIASNLGFSFRIIVCLQHHLTKKSYLDWIESVEDWTEQNPCLENFCVSEPAIMQFVICSSQRAVSLMKNSD